MRYKLYKMGWFGQLGSLKVIGDVAIRQSTHDFLFDFNRNCASVLYRSLDITSYLSKVVDFTPPHTAFGDLAGGVSSRILRRSLAAQNQNPWPMVWRYLRYIKRTCYRRTEDRGP